MTEEKKSTATEKTVEVMKVEIDGKVEEFSMDDVKNLKAQQASATQKTQQVAKILDAASRYGIEVDEFTEKSEAALDVLGGLIETGVVDAQGVVIEKDPGKTVVGKISPTETQNLATPSEDMKALTAQYNGLKGLVEEMQKDTSTLINREIRTSIKTKYPNLSEDDVTKVLSVAYKDRSKTPYEHAEVMDGLNITLADQREKDFAKKHGIDLDAYNKRKTQAADGGIGSVIKGKKIVFNPKGPDEISPAEAHAEYNRLQE